MSAFAIGMSDIWDEGWREAYRDREVLEGQAPCRTGVVMIEFPSMEDARAWYNEPEYAPLKKLRQTGAKLDLILVESLPPGSRS